MGTDSKIEWTDHTFNPWIGCTKVSPGCAHCYAETLDRNRSSKTLDGGTKEKPVSHWGPGAPRHRTSEANWNQVKAWERRSRKTGSQERVFSASLADWLDEEVPIEWLADFLRLVFETPHLTWLLLTKRPQNFAARLEAVSDFIVASVLDPAYPYSAKFDIWIGDWLEGKAPHNVWIGTTVEDQERADERIPELLRISAKVRFLSCEPLLGPVRLDPGWLGRASDGSMSVPCCRGILNGDWVAPGHDFIHWVICGGESGNCARSMHPEWARALRDQCQAAGVAFFFKQWGEWWPVDQDDFDEVCRFDDFKGEGLTLRHDGAVFAENEPHGFCCANCSATDVLRLGKAKAGRLLDGREWNEVPKCEGMGGKQEARAERSETASRRLPEGAARQRGAKPGKGGDVRA